MSRDITFTSNGLKITCRFYIYEDCRLAEIKQEMISPVRSAVECGVTFFHAGVVHGLSTNEIRGIFK